MKPPMPGLFETIRVQDGQAQYLSWHLQRMLASAKALRFNLPSVMADQSSFVRCIQDFLSGSIVPPGRCRLRLDYTPESWTIAMFPYTPKSITSFRYIELPAPPKSIYPWKSSDRSWFDSSFNNSNPPCAADEELIYTWQGILVEGRYANLVVEQLDHCLTPQTVLLPGTHRERALADGILSGKPLTVGTIPLSSLKAGDRLHFINAMLDFGEVCVII